MKILSIPVNIYIYSKLLPFENTSYKNKPFIFLIKKRLFFVRKVKEYTYVYICMYIYIYIYIYI